MNKDDSFCALNCNKAASERERTSRGVKIGSQLIEIPQSASIVIIK